MQVHVRAFLELALLLPNDFISIWHFYKKICLKYFLMGNTLILSTLLSQIHFNLVKRGVFCFENKSQSQKYIENIATFQKLGQF